MRKAKLALLLLIGTVVAVPAYLLSDRQRYDRIERGMTPSEVERVMGRAPDRSDRSLASHFEEWSVGKEVCLWVEYDEQGHVIAKGLDEIRNSPSGESAIELERESFPGVAGDGAGAAQ
jgi:hypothetical protein